MNAQLFVHGNGYKIKDIEAVSFAHTTVLRVHTEENGYVEIRANAKEINAKLFELAQKTKGISVTEFHRRVLTITPEEVVTYFENSPYLREMADDVREALIGKKATNTGYSQLEADLNAVRHLASPSKADIAEILTGNRYYGGQTHKRISAVFEALSSSSTPEEDLYNEPEDLAA